MVISRGTALRLDRVSLNVADLAAATALYVGAFGCEATPAVDAGPVSPICSARGRSVSSCCGEDGSASNLQRSIPCIPPIVEATTSHSSIALVTNDIAAAYQRLSAFPFSPILAMARKGF